MTSPTTIIDIFAGPGGLGEGFTSVKNDDSNNYYRIGLSVEKEQHAFSTLRLRSFFRALNTEDRHDYYNYLKGKITKAELFNKYPYAKNIAEKETLHAELGNELSNPTQELDHKITTAIAGEKHWLLIGGPPCQAYSVVGRARNKGNKDYIAEKDQRHFLYKEYLRILGVHEPSVFVLENVRGILTSKINGEKIFPRILEDLSTPGETLRNSGNHDGGNVKYTLYSLTHPRNKTPWGNALQPRDFLVRAEDYGVPQSRHRVFVVGVRSDLDVGFVPLLKKISAKTTVRDVLSDLPLLGSRISREKSNAPYLCSERLYESLEMEWFNEISYLKITADKIEQIKKRIIEVVESKLKEQYPNTGSEYLTCPPNCNALEGWYTDKKMDFICNSTTRCHMLEDLYRYLFASCYAEVMDVSPKLGAYPESLLPNHANAKTGKFSDRFRVQLANHPSTTVTSHISKDGHFFIHYDPMQCRSLTVREAARLQTFPDNYFFEGPRTAQYTQIGNAVPPYLAYKIASCIRQLLIKIETGND